jgi:hypothetical protein
MVGSSVAPIHLGRCHHTTHHPSHEQLLVRLEAGGALFVGMRSWWLLVGCPVAYRRWWLFIAAARCPTCCQCWCPALLVSSVFSFPWLRCIGVGPPPPCHSTSNPPHEQLLVRLGAGGVLFLRRVVPLPSPVVALTPLSRVPACGVTCV